jgi:hypothetical protein
MTASPLPDDLVDDMESVSIETVTDITSQKYRFSIFNTCAIS